MTKRVALYARVSTVRQAEGDLSIPDQKRAIAAYCQQRGWPIVAEYVDAGASATDDNRPEFQRMIDDAIRKEIGFDLIVVHSYSRYFRDNLQAELYRRRLRKAGVEISSITQELGDGSHADLMRQFIGLMDEHQSRENAKHTLRGMEENARQGFVNGRAPFGYSAVAAEMRGAKVKKRLEIDPEEARTVRLIFELASTGLAGVMPMGLKEIAQTLNRRGLRTRNQRLFSTQVVHEILHRTTYIGRHVFNVQDSRTKERKPSSKHVVVAVPAIIDEVTFEAVQAGLRARRPTETAVRALNAPTLLSSLARCESCGGAMSLRTGTSRSGKVYRYYACANAARMGTHACSGRSIREDLLDRLVIDHLCNELFQPAWLRATLAQVIEAKGREREKEPRLAKSLLAEQADITSRLEKLLDLVERGLITPDEPELAARLQNLKDRRRESASRIAAVTAPARPLPTINDPKLMKFSRELRAAVGSGDIAARRAFVRLFIERIEVGKERISLCGPKTALAAMFGADKHHRWDGPCSRFYQGMASPA